MDIEGSKKDGYGQEVQVWTQKDRYEQGTGVDRERRIWTEKDEYGQGMVVEDGYRQGMDSSKAQVWTSNDE